MPSAKKTIAFRFFRAMFASMPSSKKELEQKRSAAAKLYDELYEEYEVLVKKTNPELWARLDAAARYLIDIAREVQEFEKSQRRKRAVLHRKADK